MVSVTKSISCYKVKINGKPFGRFDTLHQAMVIAYIFNSFKRFGTLDIGDSLVIRINGKKQLFKKVGEE